MTEINEYLCMNLNFTMAKNQFKIKQVEKLAPIEEPVEEVAEERPAPKPVKVKVKPIKKERPLNEDETPSFSFAFLKEERFVRICGIFFLLIALFQLIATFSYFLTWWRDYDLLETMTPSMVLFDPQHQIDNIGGVMGAYLMHALIYNGFGIATLVFVFVFTILGLNLLKIKTMGVLKALAHALFIMIWTSIALGTIFFTGKYAVLAGVFGFEIANYLKLLLGLPGLGLLLLFSILCYSIIGHNTKLRFFPHFQAWKEKHRIRKEAKLAQKLAEQENLDSEEDESDNFEKENGAEEPQERRAAANRMVGERQEIIEAEEQEDDNYIPGEMQVFHREKAPEEENRDGHAPLAMTEFETRNQELETPGHAWEEEVFDDEEIKPTLSSLLNPDEVPFEVEMQVDETSEKAKLETGNINESEDENAVAEKLHITIDQPIDPRMPLEDFKFPTSDLLIDYASGATDSNVQAEELLENKRKIEKTLKDYSIDIVKIQATVGPTVTLYEIIPAPGVRISKIKNLEDDIALSLSALGIRIIAPIPGKGTIGIEVPNQNKQIVPMRVMLDSEKFQTTKMDLPIALGKTISNEIFITDLAKMPHLLMAGATGQGKSVGLNAIIASLLYKKHPAELKFVMVDPKKVELTLFNKIERHYLAKLGGDEDDAIITDTKKVVKTLRSLCIEMDARYDLLKDAQVKNIREYNQKYVEHKLNPNDGHRYLPYIVLIIDEFADLIMTAGKEVEQPIARLAQLARAIGIHLVIATQRPSVNIITGIIKANFPARLAFRVTSKIDSRTILDSGGADQLIGRGDMLLSTGSELIRLQCPLIDTPEIEKVTEFIGSQHAYPSAFILPDVPDENGGSNAKDLDPNERDELFEEAARLIVSAQQGSTSLIQRKMKLGYNRAGRLIDQLEAAGIVGPFEGSKAREVRIKTLEQLEQLLQGEF